MKCISAFLEEEGGRSAGPKATHPATELGKAGWASIEIMAVGPPKLETWKARSHALIVGVSPCLQKRFELQSLWPVLLSHFEQSASRRHMF